MSNENKASIHNKSKFTKGEKCIFIHLVLTFSVLIILIIIYFVHLYLVNHLGNDFYRITRRHFRKSAIPEKAPSYLSIGVVYIHTDPPRIMCNCLLLKTSWSVAPAHCIVIRSDPELSHLLPHWRVKYKTDEDQHKETDIRRGIVHSNFNEDDFENNIGVFEHKIPVDSVRFHVHDFKISNEALKSNKNEMKVVNWKNQEQQTIHPVYPLSLEKCNRYLTSIESGRRNFEFCVVRDKQKNITLDIGAVLIVNTKVIGLYSWGDRNCRGIPFVFLNISPYKNWIDNVITL